MAMEWFTPVFAAVLVVIGLLLLLGSLGGLFYLALTDAKARESRKVTDQPQPADLQSGSGP